jgi:hypothetical protein
MIPPSSRREFLSRSGMGIGWLALLDLMSREAVAAERPTVVPGPHRTPRAKAVISLFMHGGPSQVDTFDPKPLLAKYSGQTLPASCINAAKSAGRNPVSAQRGGGLRFGAWLAAAAQSMRPA